MQLDQKVMSNRTTVAEKFDDETVKELESLKNAFVGLENQRNNGNVVSVSTTQSSVISDVNDLNGNGKLAKVSEKVDFVKTTQGQPKSIRETETQVPLKGIHKVFGENSANLEEAFRSAEKKKKQTDSPEAEENENADVKYSPLYMADYIFWTGDEETVVSTIEEFLREGLISRQEAINFLQSLKTDLNFIQAHYENLQKLGDKISSKLQGKVKLESKFSNLEVFGKKSKEADEQSETAKLVENDVRNPKSDSFGVIFSAANIQKSPYVGQIPKSDLDERTKESDRDSIPTNEGLSGFDVFDNNEDTMEQLKVSDFLYKKYSLEEVIFPLSRVIFSDSFSKGNKEARTVLHSFSAFLLNEVKGGQLFRNLEKKIFDALVTALVVTLSEHPELMNRAIKELQNLKDQNTTFKNAKKVTSPGYENGNSKLP